MKQFFSFEIRPMFHRHMLNKKVDVVNGLIVDIQPTEGLAGLYIYIRSKYDLLKVTNNELRINPYYYLAEVNDVFYVTKTDNGYLFLTLDTSSKSIEHFLKTSKPFGTVNYEVFEDKIEYVLRPYYHMLFWNIGGNY